MAEKFVWRIKKEYFRQLKSGRKRIEVRVGYPNIKKVKEGDVIIFENYGPYEFDVVRVSRYLDFGTMLKAENVADVLPGMTFGEAIAALREIYPRERELLGVYAFELQLKTDGDVALEYYSASELLSCNRNKAFSKVVAESYMITDWIVKDYPDHCKHFYGKYVPGILSGEREIIACYANGRNVGIAILKKDAEERKISTLFVKTDYRGKGIAQKLLEKSFAWLGTTKPVITIADYKLEQFAKIIEQYDWKETRILSAGYYNDRSREHVFNEDA